MRREYAELAAMAGPSFSLEEMFSFKQFRIRNYCRGYAPNPHAAGANQATRLFCERYGIWLKGGEWYVTCAAYLYPTAGPYRLELIAKAFAWSFYLNDTFGREKFSRLSPELQEEIAEIRQRVLLLEEDLCTGPLLSAVEQANVEILREIRDASPAGWFREFLQLWKQQVNISHVNLNALIRGRVPTVAEYIENRNHVSGMYYSVALMEFGDDRYLDGYVLSQHWLTGPVQELRWLTCAIGALMNDLFSFEKECIDESSEYNLVPLLLLRNPSLTLPEAIELAANKVMALIGEFVSLAAHVKNQCLPAIDKELAASLAVHLHSLERCVQASWVWQLYTMRYKRLTSIWKEANFSIEN